MPAEPLTILRAAETAEEPALERAAEAPLAPGVVDAHRSRPAIPYLPGIEGLRGLALLAVLLYHNGFTWMRGGFLGVSTFFTLSGFLITLLLVWERSATGTISLRSFWTRRYRRLMPAALLTLAGVVVFGWLVATPGQLATLRGDVLAALAYVANWRFIVTGQSYGNLFAAPSPVLHFWSLAIEEQFYLVFPVVVYLVFRVAKGSRRALGGVLAVLSLASLGSMFLLYTPGQDPSRVYYGTGTRALELLFGSLLALALSHRKGFVLRVPGWAWELSGLVAAAVVVVLWVETNQTSAWLYEGGLAAYALMSCLVIVAAIRRGPLRALMSWRPLRALGVISYGAYLFHWPIYLWLTPARTHLSPWPLFGVRLVVTLALATASARLLENPVRRGQLTTRLRPAWLSVVAIAVIVVTLFAVTAPAAHDQISFAAPPPPKLTAAERASATSTTVVAGTATSASALPQKVPMVAGQPTRVLFVGDSAALTLGGGLSGWGTGTGQMKVWAAGKLGCPLGLGGQVRYLNKAIADYPDCDWTTQWPGFLAADHPHVVAVLFGLWDVADRLLPGDTRWRAIGDPVYDKWLRNQMSMAIDMLSSSGATVVWLTHPYVTVGITEGLSGPFPEESHHRMDLFNKMVREVVATKPRAQVLDLQAHMRALPEGEMNRADRPDGEHWTPATAAALGPWLGGSLIDIAKGDPPLPTRKRD